MYQYEGPVAATLEVRHEAGRCVVRLEGGGSSAKGLRPLPTASKGLRAMSMALSCVPGSAQVETDTFSYGAAQAESEARMVRIAFETGAAQVIGGPTRWVIAASVSSSRGRCRADG